MELLTPEETVGDVLQIGPVGARAGCDTGPPPPAPMTELDPPRFACDGHTRLELRHFDAHEEVAFDLLANAELDVASVDCRRTRAVNFTVKPELGENRRQQLPWLANQLDSLPALPRSGSPARPASKPPGASR